MNPKSIRRRSMRTMKLLTLILAVFGQVELIEAFLSNNEHHAYGVRRFHVKNRATGKSTHSTQATKDVVDDVLVLHDDPTTPIDKKGGVMYRQSVLSKEEFKTIKEDVSSVMTKLNEETTSSVATKRLGASLPSNNPTVQILRNGKISELIRKMVGCTYELVEDLPVEVRLYEKVGSGMSWHSDDVLYDPPQIEAVITLENNSDCVTMWKDAKTGTLHSQETDSNSVLLLRAGGPLHCVTSLKWGRRVILKAAYAANGARFREGLHKNQFGSAKKKKKKRRAKR